MRAAARNHRRQFQQADLAIGMTAINRFVFRANDAKMNIGYVNRSALSDGRCPWLLQAWARYKWARCLQNFGRASLSPRIAGR